MSSVKFENRVESRPTRRLRPPKVIYWNSEASPYFVRRMNTLHNRGNISIEAWFSELRATDRDWSVEPDEWRFRSRLLPRGLGRAARAIALLGSERPDVFVSLYGDYAFASAVLAAKARRTPVVIHAMRTFPAWRRRSVLREAAKHALFRIADGIQVAGPDSRAYAEEYGAAPHGVFAIREDVDLPFWRHSAGTRESARRTLRAAHGISGCLFLYVGRLWRGKGLASLLEAYRTLRADSCDCSLALVGGGEDEAWLRAQTRSLDGVVFAGFLEGPALKAWYSAADVFVFPTLGDPYGHVVQEAMASGLPVITTTAAGDIADRVVEGHTGYLVPPDDSPGLARRMRQIQTDSKLRERLGTSGRERIQDWSTERWATQFEEMISAVLRLRWER